MGCLVAFRGIYPLLPLRRRKKKKIKVNPSGKEGVDR